MTAETKPAQQPVQFTEANLDIYRQYSKCACLYHMVETAMDIVEGPTDGLCCEDSWKTVLRIENWLDQQPRDKQKAFIEAFDVVVEKNREEVREHPSLQGLAASMPGTTRFLNHLKAVLHKLLSKSG